MNKDYLEEKAQLYALGTLPEEEVDAFERYVRGDREAQLIVHEYQRLTELEIRAGQQEPPFNAYASIMEEIDGVPAAAADPAASGKSKLVSFAAWAGWAAAACIAVLFVLQLGQGTTTGEASDRMESDIVLNDLANPRLVQVATPSEDFGFEDRMLELAGLAEAYWFSREGIPSDQLLADQETEIDELSGGFTVFDRRYRIGFIAVENLPKEAPDKSYHVWARGGRSGKPMRAGTLPIGDESRGLFFFDLTSLPSEVEVDTLSFFVTEEASETPAEPSSIVVLRDF